MGEKVYAAYSWTEGKKTAAGMVVVILLSGLRSLGYLDEPSFNVLMQVALAIGGVGLADKVARRYQGR